MPASGFRGPGYPLVAAPALPAAAPAGAADFDAAWATVDSVYPYLGYKGIPWRALRWSYRLRAVAARGEAALALLAGLLAELRDGHVFLRTRGGTTVAPYVPPRMLRDRRAFSRQVVSRYLARGARATAGGRFESGMLGQDIGYLYVSAFEPAGVAAELDEALAGLRGARSLVVDNRSSVGGSRAEVYRVLGRFIAAPVPGPEWYTLGERRRWPVIEPDGPVRYTRPVVLLANGLTFSAAELFTDLMAQLPHVTVVGDTTGGGSGGCDDDATGDYVLPSGIEIRIPTVDGRRADGTPWETVGVEPDVRVAQTEQDLRAGRDRQLERALELLGAGARR